MRKINVNNIYKIIDHEIVPVVIKLVLDAEYDHEIEDGGGTRGEDLYVTETRFHNEERFKRRLRNILLAVLVGVPSE